MNLSLKRGVQDAVSQEDELSSENSRYCRYGSEAARKLLHSNGIVDLDSAFNLGRVIHERYEAKSVSVAHLNEGDEEIRVYVKKQWKPARLIPRMHTILSGNALASYPLREWRGMMHLRRLGLVTAEPLALFQHPLNPFRSAIITRAVPRNVSLMSMLMAGEIGRLGDIDRAALADAVISVINTIHSAGFGWRSMSIKHFFPEQLDSGEWRIWLIDCEGVFSRVKPRHIDRERRSIINSIHTSGNGDRCINEIVGVFKKGLLSY